MSNQQVDTASVSKGVFVFKNGIKAASKRKKVKKYTVPPNDMFANNLWYQSYFSLWSDLEFQIEELNNNMFSSVLSNLVEFVKNSYSTKVNEIPTAALLTGINMPDHKAQFTALSNKIKKSVSPHVACLYSQDCQNVKYLVENMINQFVNEEGYNSDEEEAEDDKKNIKKSLFSFPLLQSWYEDLYEDKTEKDVLVVIIPDFESFNSKVLHDFILITSNYNNILPFVLVFGIATSLETLNTSLPYQVSKKISVQVFHSQPSTIYLNSVLENIFFTSFCPFQLGGKIFNLFTDIFLFYDLSVTGFIQNIKYAMLEHFSYGNAMSLCLIDKKGVRLNLNQFDHSDFENARSLPSFKRLLENSTAEDRNNLENDDDILKVVLDEEITKIKRYIRRFHIFLKCLLILMSDLPKSPLGKQVRELYSIATSENITKTAEFKECFQLLNFQSKEELCNKLTKIVEYIHSLINESYGKPNKLKEFADGLETFVNNMNTISNLDEVEEENLGVTTIPTISGVLDRKQLKEKLLNMRSAKPMNKYEKLRQNIVNYLIENFEIYLVEPSSLYFHEIFFFNDISIKTHIMGTHRSAIHTALNDPHYYLQCECCFITNDSVIKRCMPDICIAYKLHLECGKMINLYDWLQAFLSILDPIQVDDESKRIVKPELQARFTQAVAELEFLGFIKSSKRKADHVTRLTWGG